jgi:hypothetical protein
VTTFVLEPLVAGTAELSFVAVADVDDAEVAVAVVAEEVPLAVGVAARPRAASAPLVPTTLPTASASVTRRARWATCRRLAMVLLLPRDTKRMRAGGKPGLART